MNQGWGSITQTSTAAQEFCVARRDDNRISSHVPDTLLHHSHRSRDIPFLLWIFCPNRPKTQKSCSYSPVYRSTFSPFINFQGYYTLVVINAPILRSLEESPKRSKSRCGYEQIDSHSGTENNIHLSGIAYRSSRTSRNNSSICHDI